MSRAVHADTLAALRRPGAVWVRLFHLTWPGGGSLSRTDAGAAVTDADPARIYSPSPELVGVGDIAETAEPKSNPLNLTFEAVTPAMVGAALRNPASAFRLEIRRAAVDADFDVVGASILRFAGRGADGPDVRGDSDGPSVAIAFASHWAAWGVVSGRRTGAESQAAHFPGDRGFDFAGDADDRKLKWGGA